MPNQRNQQGGSRGGGRGGRGGRGNNRGNQPYDKNQRNNKRKSNDNRSGGGKGGEFSVSVFNCGNASKGDLIKFIKERAGNSQLYLNNINIVDGGRMFCTVRSQADANAVKKADGANFHGQKLSVRVKREAGGGGGGGGDDGSGGGGGGGGKQLSRDEATIVRNFVVAHYNAAAKLLNLSNIRGAQGLNGVNANWGNKGFVAAVYQAIRTTCEDVVSISFEKNGLKNLWFMRDLHKCAPALQNISLRSNNITHLNEFDHMSDLVHLRELICLENPVVQLPDYRSDLARRFEALALLDGAPVESVIKFDMPVPKAAIVVRPGFTDTTTNKEIALTFLQSYFACYDAERTQLLPAYAELNAFFSLTVMDPPPNEKGKGNRNNRNSGQKNSNMLEDNNDYPSISRNLIYRQSITERKALVHRGRIDIVSQLQKLPATKHNTRSFVIDAFSMPNVTEQLLCIKFSGMFWEDAAGVNRSFDRTMVITPNMRGGANYVIVSDMLHIRPCTELIVSSPEKGPAAAHPAMPAGMAPVQMMAPISGGASILMAQHGDVAQEKALQSFMMQTGLKLQFARECLEKNGWNFEKALYDLNTLRSQGLLAPTMFN